jgi:hypothetical protein
MKVENMTGSNGNKIPNQFLIADNSTVYFQSYDTIIAKKSHKDGRLIVHLDREKWDYSRTTGKYRNIFLGENQKETKKKIASGEYQLADHKVFSLEPYMLGFGTALG